MFRTKIPENTGMIFLESQPKKLSVWMKNTFLPLDILFFNGDKKITKILTNLKPLDETPFQSDEPVLGFVELPAGTVQKNKIEIGDKIKF